MKAHRTRMFHQAVSLQVCSVGERRESRLGGGLTNETGGQVAVAGVYICL